VTATRQTHLTTRSVVSARRVGYSVSIVINVIMLYVANHLLVWDLLPFLTTDFGRVLWLIDVSLIATVLANLVWIGYDVDWFKALSQIGLNLISALAAIRMYQVFPFDFSDYEFGWAPIARFVIILTIVGLALGTIAELVKVARSGFRALK
jgi:hypothetical protein